jgi:hypothetical protein
MLIEGTLKTGTTPGMVTEPLGAAVLEIQFAGGVVGSPSIPAFIPADQAYFWSNPWQESERRALADLAEGHSRSFADPMDAVRYLLGAD